MDRTPNAYASFMGGIPEVVTTRQMRAVEAAALYTAALPGARETGRMAPPGRERPLTIAFEWRGQAFMLLDDGPEAAFTDSVSIAVTTADQAETDALWNALTADGGRGVSRTCWYATANGDSPSNGGCPVTDSYITQPSA